MNKRFSTILTMVLLLMGALFSNANAALTYKYTAGASTQTLKNGLKVYLSDAGVNFLSSTGVSGKSGSFTFKTGTDAEWFEIADFGQVNNEYQFKLKNQNGKLIYAKAGVSNVEAADAAAVDANTCVFVASKNTTDATITLGGQNLTVDLSSGSDVKFYFASATYTAEELNKNLSNNGFSFVFPEADPQPETNVFNQTVYAVSKTSTQTNVTDLPDGLYFVTKGGKALQEKITANTGAVMGMDEFKNAEFIILDPSAPVVNLIKANGEGYGFKVVKGSDLKATGDLAKDKINCVNNAVFTVSEDDYANEPGKYTMVVGTTSAKPYVVVESGKAPVEVASAVDYSTSFVKVYAYKPASGVAKTYITTISTTTGVNISKAQITGTTWAPASALLKEDAAKIVNIKFVGEKPDAAGAAASPYGKYLVSQDATTFAYNAVAPKDVRLNSAKAQWIVTGFSNSTFTFKNRETDQTIALALYSIEGKTNEFTVASSDKSLTTPSVTSLAGQTIQITDAPALDDFLTLTAEQLAQKAELVFNGSDMVAVPQLYMTENKTNVFVPTKESDDSQLWTVVKGRTLKNEIDYAYLSNGSVKTDKKNAVEVVTYKFQSVKGADEFLQTSDFKEGANAAEFIFQKDLEGNYTMIVYATSYANIFATQNSATKVVASISANSAFDVSKKKYEDAEYSSVNVVFNRLTESLDASTPRKATLDSYQGAVAMNLNANGIMEGVIADKGLTFRLDTADINKDIPSFYISKAIEGDEDGYSNFLFYPTDSIQQWVDDKADYEIYPNYALEGSYTGEATADEDLKAIFRPAIKTGVDTVATYVNGDVVTVAKEANEEKGIAAGVENFKFRVMVVDGGYVIQPLGATDKYLYNLNGRLGFTEDQEKALVITLGDEQTVDNSTIDASSVSVIAIDGAIIVKGAQGKKVTVSNVLGQTIANTVISSDEATIAAPKGYVTVAVEGEAAVKAIVK